MTLGTSLCHQSDPGAGRGRPCRPLLKAGGHWVTGAPQAPPNPCCLNLGPSLHLIQTLQPDPPARPQDELESWLGFLRRVQRGSSFRYREQCCLRIQAQHWITEGHTPVNSSPALQKQLTVVRVPQCLAPPPPSSCTYWAEHHPKMDYCCPWTEPQTHI